MGHYSLEVGGAQEADGVTGSEGCISDSLSEEALAHAGSVDEQDVLGVCQELE